MGKKKTHEEFVRDFKEKSKYANEIEFLTEYQSAKGKILCKCNVCNYEWESSPTNLLQNKGCPKCKRKVTLTFDEFLKKFKEDSNYCDSITLSNYNGLSKYIDCKCLVCEHQWQTIANNLLKGHGCSKCAGNAKRNTFNFVKEMSKIYDDEYTVIGEYVNARTKVRIRHICGREWDVSPDNILHKKTQCPSCSKHRTYTNEMFVDMVKQINPNIEIIEPYISMYSNIKYRCRVCGRENYKLPVYILNKKFNFTCDFCNPRKCIDNEKYLIKLKSKQIDVLPLEDYIGSKTKIMHRCNKCGTEWSVKPANLLSGFGCPYCSSSKGEKKIEHFLKEHNIAYKKEYSFDDLKSNRNYKVRFDFAIFLDDGVVSCLCEYDGIQHFQPVRFTSNNRTETKEDAEIVYRETQERDRLKNDYCNNHNIDLIRIPYWDYDNIETILSRKLNIE